MMQKNIIINNFFENISNATQQTISKIAGSNVQKTIQKDE